MKKHSLEVGEFLRRLEALLGSNFTAFDVVMFVKRDEMAFYLLSNCEAMDYSVPLTLIDGTDDGRLPGMLGDDRLACFRLDSASVRWDGSIWALGERDDLFGHMIRQLG
mgnify:CR=1 FL=1